MRWTWLAFVVVVLAPSIGVGQSPSPADLAIRSRAILATHCEKCHGDKPAPSDLKILDHAQLVKDRPAAFVRAMAPTASQLLELVEQGSMPPGKNAKLSANEIATLREWVAGGAASFPVRFDDEFAHATILADVQKVEPDNTAAFRYLSLHHLVSTLSAEDFANAQRDFLSATSSVLKPGAEPQPIDPTATIFRIDLQKAGWHHRPFKKLDAKGEDAGPADGNLFDAVLLEYPFGVIPDKSPAFDKLGAAFLKPARQVRPFAFVRGDWFADITTSSPLADDLREMIKQFEPVPSGLAKPKARLTQSKFDKRSIAAIDSWYGSDSGEDTTVKGLRIETLDIQGKPQTQFKAEERFRLRIAADEAMHFQVVWVDSAGRIDTRTSVEAYDPAKGPRDLVLPTEGGLSNQLGKERLIVIASPKPFASAEAWRAKHETKSIERFVHPFFALKQRGENYVPDVGDLAVMRRTVVIEVK